MGAMTSELKEGSPEIGLGDRPGWQVKKTYGYRVSVFFQMLAFFSILSLFWHYIGGIRSKDGRVVLKSLLSTGIVIINLLTYL